MTNRSRLVAVTAAALVTLLSACSGSTTTVESAARTSAAPTSEAPATTEAIACHDTLVEQTEGPYYTPGAPERTDITGDATVGISLTLTGRVLDASCAPVAGAPIEFWQADGAGVYDNSGYELRGAQVTDANGAYTLDTVIPGIYPSRTEHIHVKVTGPDGVLHTTQVYFPDVPQNDSDGIYSETMVVTVTDRTDDSMAATFDFVLP
ncbi:MAG: dioxygenase [Actinobacteria bacterium]|jgi:protocatechuate 3,4-dioxygenase beta subunit|nr:dioxygenase [Actinomycetota bacterium]